MNILNFDNRARYTYKRCQSVEKGKKKKKNEQQNVDEIRYGDMV